MQPSGPQGQGSEHCPSVWSETGLSLRSHQLRSQRGQGSLLPTSRRTKASWCWNTTTSNKLWFLDLPWLNTFFTCQRETPGAPNWLCDRILIVPHTILSNWTPSKIMKTKHWVSVTAAYLLLQAPFLSPVVPVFIVSCPLPRYVLGLTSLQLSNTFDKCCGSKLEISQPCTWTDIASKRSWCPQERRDAVREAQPSTRDCNNSIPRSIQPAKRLVITPL